MNATARGNSTFIFSRWAKGFVYLSICVAFRDAKRKELDVCMCVCQTPIPDLDASLRTLPAPLRPARH